MALLFFLVVIPIAVFGFAFHAKFLKRLRADYPEIWRSLGSPGLLWNNSPRSSLLTLKYLLKGEFRALGNREFVQMCERLRIFVITYLAGFGVWFMITLVWTIYAGAHPT